MSGSREVSRQRCRWRCRTIDRTKGIGGVLMTQLLPFFDLRVIETLMGFEMAVYQQAGAAVPAASEREADPMKTR